MPQNDLRRRPPRQHMNHLIAPHPIIMIPSQPALRMRILIILPHVILIRHEDPRPAIRHDLQEAKPQRRAQRKPQDHPWVISRYHSGYYDVSEAGNKKSRGLVVSKTWAVSLVYRFSSMVSLAELIQ
jgi:hypothetical protein